LLLVPITKLYDLGTTLHASELLAGRQARLAVAIHPNEAARLQLGGAQIELSWNGRTEKIDFVLDESVPEGAALVPRSVGLGVIEPAQVTVGHRGSA
jgi:hypothetical protein